VPSQLILGATLQALGSPDEFVANVRELEHLGLDHVWVADSGLLASDVYVYLALAAAASQRVILGTNVTNPQTRHPAITVNAIASLNRIAEGRICLGLGAGGGPLQELGIPVGGLDGVRETVELARRLFSGEHVDFDGRTMTIRGAFLRYGLNESRSPKIYVTASGPRMLQLAGELADGVLVQCGAFAEGIEFARAQVKLGADRVGRSLDDVDFAWLVFGVLEDDLSRARDIGRTMASWFPYRSDVYCRLAGIPAEIVSAVREAYNGGEFSEAYAAHALTSDEMVDKFVIAGPVDVWSDRFSMAREHGIHHLEIFGLGDRMRLYRTIADIWLERR